jgi:hypothetical protein
MLADCEDVLSLANEQIRAILEMLRDGARTKTLPRTFRPLIKNVVENQRSALDYTAQVIYDQWATKKKPQNVYWPLAKKPEDFPSLMEGNFPGVAATRPDIRDAIERHQMVPTRWPQNLHALTIENKHINLSEQTHINDELVRVFTDETAYMGYSMLRVASGRLVDAGNASQEMIDRLAFDPETRSLMLVPGEHAEWMQLWDWAFTDLNAHVASTLVQIQHGVRVALQDISSVAGL